MFGDIDHVGVAVKDLDKALKLYSEKLGLGLESVVVNERDGVRIALLRVGNNAIELLEPSSPDSLLVRFLERRGEGVHHVCMRVSNIEEAMGRLREDGIRLVDETPRTSPFGGRIAFVHPKSTHGALIELYEE
ncbi:MAG: methylmalonyl-CoA epimerase [Candidatus Bathyarchaeia archaeon]